MTPLCLFFPLLLLEQQIIISPSGERFPGSGHQRMREAVLSIIHLHLHPVQTDRRENAAFRSHRPVRHKNNAPDFGTQLEHHLGGDHVDRAAADWLLQTISRVQQPPDPDLLSLKAQHRLAVCPFPKTFFQHFRRIFQKHPRSRHAPCRSQKPA